MHDDQGESALWQPCPPGTLADLAGRLRGRRRRRFLARLAVAPLVLLAAGAAAMVAIGRNDPRPGETNPPGGSVAIKCKECKQLLPLYLAGSLPPDQTEKMRVHLAKCRPCREVMEKMRSSVASLDHECDEPGCPLCRAGRTGAGALVAHGAAPLEAHFHVARLGPVREPQ
ncbi:MAG: zf-HC2 domain-containing protein [Planctomycetia bacterium]|nr:zf-HC2 domain-containing protein [Planctomycetia bacterium]